MQPWRAHTSSLICLSHSQKKESDTEEDLGVCTLAFHQTSTLYSSQGKTYSLVRSVWTQRSELLWSSQDTTHIIFVAWSSCSWSGNTEDWNSTMLPTVVHLHSGAEDGGWYGLCQTSYWPHFLCLFRFVHFSFSFPKFMFELAHSDYLAYISYYIFTCCY